MRIAVVDLLFKWPTEGGAAKDLAETFTCLATRHEVRIFRPARPHEHLSNAGCPLPIEIFRCREWQVGDIITELQTRLKAWRPDVVFIGDGWTMKARVGAALSGGYPVILRFYAYEMLCPRNNELWRHTHACDFPAKHDPGVCLECAKQYQSAIRESKGADNPLTSEAHAAEIWNGDYWSDIEKLIHKSARLIVYNRMLARFIADRYGKEADVVPGGVDPDEFAQIKELSEQDWKSRPVRILGLGRMDDPAKGGEVLIEGARMLRKTDFPVEVILTRTPRSKESWIFETGRLNRQSVKHELERCHIVAAPSEWQESFGMAWLEGMAAGRPVVTTRVAGPAEYLQNREHAVLVTPGSAGDIAGAVKMIVEDPTLRHNLIAGGRNRARALSWSEAARQTEWIITEAVNH